MKVLLLDLSNSSTEEIYDRLLTKGSYDVSKINVNEQKIGDFLLIPDSGGINCNTQAFMPHYRVPPQFKGQHQWLEFWRIETSDYYKNSSIRMVGFGTSAFLLYDILLGGKLCVNDSKELELVESNLALVEGNKWTTDQHTGYTSGSIRENLNDFYSLLAGHRTNPGNEGGELVTADVGMPVVPPIVRYNHNP